ncbi:aldehyde dehydrogenase [Phyllosticta citrichinensis]|uniref:aldehyde dehydrogenase (NAD(+)) n=1 Tax=Phyllosticta citrichinensis TaxID=1130410 RepID=A0ABR1XZ99_9PEZI
MASNSDIRNRLETRLFINGKFVESSDKQTFRLVSPSTRELIAEVSEASAQDVNTAVAAAKAAQPAWAALSPPERGACLRKFGNLMRENMKELATLEAMSMGRPVRDYIDVYVGARLWDWFSEAGWAIQGSTSLNNPGMVGMTLLQPYGVAAGIIPWNAPMIFFSSKAAPALACGNSIIIKSSEKAPLTSAFLATLIEKSGFPPGVFNVLSGHGTVSGATLASHMDVRTLSFTGSTATGRAISIAAAKSNLKNLHLELGGKSPAVVFEDADLESAAATTQFGIGWNAGQICMGNSRIYVQDSVAEKFINLFKEKWGSVKMGNPLDPEVGLGPLADSLQYEKVNKYIEIGKSSGAKVVLGGDKPTQSSQLGNGYYVPATIFGDISEDSKTMKEEVFGPVVCINTFKTEEEVIEKANDTEYGLYAAVFTTNHARALRVAKAIQAGTVGINCSAPTNLPDLPFGGFKSSGVGREGMIHSMRTYLEEKSVMTKL